MSADRFWKGPGDRPPQDNLTDTERDRLELDDKVIVLHPWNAPRTERQAPERGGPGGRGGFGSGN